MGALLETTIFDNKQIDKCNMSEKQSGKAKIAGNYRVQQPIENFKIRVKIVQQRSSLAELFENEDDIGDSNFLEAEERTFSWQEKVLGPLEIKLYEEEENCDSPAQREYHEMVKDGVEPSRLYSYTSKDDYHEDKNLLTRPFSSKIAKRNDTALPMVKNRKPFEKRYNKAVVDFKPQKDRIRTNHYLYKDHEIMHIMADLSSKNEEASVSNEALLCTITYDKASKNLTVNPDFTNKESYTVDGVGMSYDYWIYHASECQSADDLRKQIKILKREMKKLQLYKESLKFREIKLPPVNVLRIFVNLDVTSAHNFPYDALFVNYFITLPSNWTAGKEESLAGRTQRCRMKNGVAHFSYVAEIMLDFDLGGEKCEEFLPSWPQLLISVASLDSWTRYRIEGYASVPLPTFPGSHDIVMHTWRPTGDFINTLRRFFTGGTYEIEDITYCGIPTSQDDSKLDKSNLKVVSSGFVKLRLNIVHQSQISLKGTNVDASVNKLSTEQFDAVDVLKQFKIARNRMKRGTTTKW